VEIVHWQTLKWKFFLMHPNLTKQKLQNDIMLHSNFISRTYKLYKNCAYNIYHDILHYCYFTESTCCYVIVTKQLIWFLPSVETCQSWCVLPLARRIWTSWSASERLAMLQQQGSILASDAALCLQRTAQNRSHNARMRSPLWSNVSVRQLCHFTT